jgi:peptide/nickel transport system ATP-binding protein
VDSGGIRHHGAEITDLPDRKLRTFRRRCQIVFQDPFSSLDPRMRVGAIVREALRGEPGLNRAAADRRVNEVLEAAGLSAGFAGRLPHQLSGGQRQRVAIARAIVRRPELIVADEPISALDMTVQRQILDLVGDLQRRFGFSCIFISHDLGAVQQVANRIVVMEAGRIVEEGDSETIFARPKHAFTRRLIAASPVLGARCVTNEETEQWEISNVQA